MSEVWTVQKCKSRVAAWHITSNKSKWFIAENLSEKHAELVCKLFNERVEK